MANYTSVLENGAAVDAELIKVRDSNLNPAHKITRSATVVVAASNSSAKSKAQADYVCDGTDDDLVINNAISSLTAERTYYEKITCLEGNYATSDSLLIPDYTIFEMFGNVKLDNSSDVHVIRNSDSKNGNNNIRIFGGSYNGNASNQSLAVDGIFFNKVNNAVVENVHVTYPKSHCLHLNTSSNILLRGNTCEYSGDDNFAIGPLSSRVSVVNCIGRYGTASYAPASSGFEIDDGSNRISLNGCLAYENAGAGIDIHNHSATDGPTDITISGCISEANSVSGINISGTSGAPSQPKRIALSGNVFQNNPIGVNIYQEVCNVNIVGNLISNSTATDGVYLGTLLDSILISGNEIIGNTECGIDDHPNLKNSTISNNIISGNGQNGISLESSYNLVTGNKIIYNTLNGIDCRGIGASIVNNFIGYNTQHGITLTGASNALVENNVIVDNDYLDSSTYVGIYGGTTPTNNTIIGNKIYVSTAGTRQLYGIRLNNGTNNVVINNMCVQGGKTGNILNGATGTVFKNNVGYVTENTGTATITTGQTTVDVSHGLVAAPTRVLLSPTTATAGKQYYVSAKAATTFTITIDSVAEGDVTFDWQATL